MAGYEDAEEAEQRRWVPPNLVHIVIRDYSEISRCFNCDVLLQRESGEFMGYLLYGGAGYSDHVTVCIDCFRLVSPGDLTSPAEHAVVTQMRVSQIKRFYAYRSNLLRRYRGIS